MMCSDAVVQGNRGKVGRSLAGMVKGNGDAPVASSEDEEDPLFAPAESYILIRLHTIYLPRSALPVSPPKKSNGFPGETPEVHRLLYTVAA